MAISDNTVRILDVDTAEEAFRLRRDSISAKSVAFTHDGRFILTAGDDGTILWDAANGRLVCQLVTFNDGSWVAADSSGRFDASNPDAIRGLNWTTADDPLRPLPVEIFMRDYYEPRLLSRIFGGEAFPTIPDVSNRNRVQPVVEILDAQRTGSDSVKVQVKVSAHVHSESGTASGMQDLHLFRDGQLVGLRSLEGATKQTIETFQDIQLPHTGVDQAEFTAYAFNDDGVKSETTAPFAVPITLPRRKGRAYIVAIGVDTFQKHQPHVFRDLRYAAQDAIGYADALGESLRQSDAFDETVVIPLTSRLSERHLDTANATTQNIASVFALLAGRKPSPEFRIPFLGADKLRRAAPDDFVVITISTHGFTLSNDSQKAMLGGKVGEFYLAPTDIGDQRPEKLLDRCVSGEQLASWLRDIDAGEMVMIIDACQSAGATGQDFKPGPMGSRGLGQLAYNKRMRLLAASQVTQPAGENSMIGHGLLSYALLDGLKSRTADTNPVDGRITVKEWLSHGEQRVPQVAASLIDGTFQLASHRNAMLLPGKKPFEFQQPVLFDFSKGKEGPVIQTIQVNDGRQ